MNDWEQLLSECLMKQLVLISVLLISPFCHAAPPAWEFQIREPGYKAIQERESSMTILIVPTDPSFEFYANPIRLAKPKGYTTAQFRQQAINLVERLDFSLDYLGH